MAYIDIPAHAMGSRENVVGVEQRCSAMELAVVHEPCDPWVTVNTRGSSSDYPYLLVDLTAAFFCKKKVRVGYDFAIDKNNYI